MPCHLRRCTRETILNQPQTPENRLHRALGWRTPVAAYGAWVKAKPSRDPVDVEGYRIRHDRVDDAGKVTLRYAVTLIHIGIERATSGTGSSCWWPGFA